MARMRLAHVIMVDVLIDVRLAPGIDGYSEYSLIFDIRYVGCRTQSRREASPRCKDIDST
jgi:hypothetical protein